jgi:hypothetical protein
LTERNNKHKQQETPGLVTPFRPTVYSGCSRIRTSGAGCVWLICSITNGKSKLPVVAVLADLSVKFSVLSKEKSLAVAAVFVVQATVGELAKTAGGCEVGVGAGMQLVMAINNGDQQHTLAILVK